MTCALQGPSCSISAVPVVAGTRRLCEDLQEATGYSDQGFSARQFSAFSVRQFPCARFTVTGHGAVGEALRISRRVGMYHAFSLAGLLIRHRGTASGSRKHTWKERNLKFAQSSPAAGWPKRVDGRIQANQRAKWYFAGHFALDGPLGPMIPFQMGEARGNRTSNPRTPEPSNAVACAVVVRLGISRSRVVLRSDWRIPHIAFVISTHRVGSTLRADNNSRVCSQVVKTCASSEDRRRSFKRRYGRGDDGTRRKDAFHVDHGQLEHGKHSRRRGRCCLVRGDRALAQRSIRGITGVGRVAWSPSTHPTRVGSGFQRTARWWDDRSFTEKVCSPGPVPQYPLLLVPS